LSPSRQWLGHRLTSHQFGAWGERVARGFLEGTGHRIIAVNAWRFGRLSEVDIVAVPDGPSSDCRITAFVEVKARRLRPGARGWQLESALHSVGSAKQARIRRCASWLMSLGRDGFPGGSQGSAQLGRQARFDVVIVELHSQGQVLMVRHITDAFY